MANTVRTEDQLLDIFADNTTGNITPQDMRDLIVSAQIDVATEHFEDTSNPHEVTAAQVGALVSVNSVSNSGGNIDLVAGTNITITPNDGSNTITIDAAGGSTPAGGSNTQIQYNNSSAFGGDSGFTTNGAGSVNITGDLDVDNLNLNGNTLSSTDVNGLIIITPNGNGTIQVNATGDARGTNAIDFQFIRNANTQVASGIRSFIAGGRRNTASGKYAFAGGTTTVASGDYSNSEGKITTASGQSSHAEGARTTASNTASHAEGYGCVASSFASHAEGNYTVASTQNATHAEGDVTTASGRAAHSEGKSTIASGDYTHAQGRGSNASGYCSHAEGYKTISSNHSSHAEGLYTTASGAYSHAEGDHTTASAVASRAGGRRSSSRFIGGIAQASGGFSSVVGSAQNIEVILFGETTTNSATELFIANNGSSRLVLDNNQTWFFEIFIVARRTDTGSDSAGYRIEGVIKRVADAASTAIIGSTLYVVYEESAGWDVAVSADTTNGSLKLEVTGETGATIHWVACAKITETK